MIYFSVCFPEYLKFVCIFRLESRIWQLGLKFKAKGVIVVTEKQLKAIPCGIRRSIEFEMVEGDFKIFKGAWQIEEVSSTWTH